MMFTTTLVLSAALLLGAAPTKTDRTKERLAKGDLIVNVAPVKGSAWPAATAMVVMDSPASKIWAVVRDCANYKNVLPGIIESTELKAKRKGKRKSKVSRCRVTVKVPIVKNLTSTTAATDKEFKGGKLLRTWKLVSGDYHVNRGSWTLMPFDATGKRTLVVYFNHVEPKIKVPMGIYRGTFKKAVKGIVAAIRKAAAKR